MTPPTHAFLAARLPAFDLAVHAVSAFATAADAMRVVTGHAPHGVTIAPERIAASFAGDRMFRRDGRPVAGFAELSGFFDVADGWIRTHANYPHHRARLTDIVELPADCSRAEFARRVATLSGAEVEERAAAGEAIAVRVRTEQEWASSAAGVAAASGALVNVHARSDRSSHRATGTASQPLTGVRVLDLTRVIAGPVASRALALLGADVLRIDPPALPEIAWQHLENAQGKRSALLDLRDAGGLERFRTLLTRADILLTGYRPGAVESLIGDAAGYRPGLIHGRVCAWGHRGPWAGRRGFDSIVQAASGIALVEGDGRPGALPAQILDHASGYLLASGVLDALARRHHDGGGHDVDVSLARTAAWLLAAPGRRAEPPVAAAPGPATVVTRDGITTARPPLPEFPDYPFPARAWGADTAEW